MSSQFHQLSGRTSSCVKIRETAILTASKVVAVTERSLVPCSLHNILYHPATDRLTLKVSNNKHKWVKVANNFFPFSFSSAYHPQQSSSQSRGLHLSKNINMDLGVSLKQGPQLIKSVTTLCCKNISGVESTMWQFK